MKEGDFGKNLSKNCVYFKNWALNIFVRGVLQIHSFYSTLKESPNFYFCSIHRLKMSYKLLDLELPSKRPSFLTISLQPSWK